MERFSRRVADESGELWIRFDKKFKRKLVIELQRNEKKCLIVFREFWEESY